MCIRAYYMCEARIPNAQQHVFVVVGEKSIGFRCSFAQTTQSVFSLASKCTIVSFQQDTDNHRQRLLKVLYHILHTILRTLTFTETQKKWMLEWYVRIILVPLSKQLLKERFYVLDYQNSDTIVSSCRKELEIDHQIIFYIQHC